MSVQGHIGRRNTLWTKYSVLASPSASGCDCRTSYAAYIASPRLASAGCRQNDDLCGKACRREVRGRQLPFHRAAAPARAGKRATRNVRVPRPSFSGKLTAPRLSIWSFCHKPSPALSQKSSPRQNVQSVRGGYCQALVPSRPLLRAVSKAGPNRPSIRSAAAGAIARPSRKSSI